ncbi:formate/nitrite transporter family protein [Neobacillus sp. PS3-34]|uniref:formate/nitrite transporter family protein n=1 Tax=Neobacillus sp. PS3-34 TaxID=3070678 RepID=UPI0027DEACE1|nr:formate/nitrite transporter family protein [Neobacillus sp. PS3-34]WML48046.1 formate/nitrite transporter family protein [Neobacillus sp. PS3-34]
MAVRKPQQIAQIAVEAGTYKADMPLKSMLVLGFLGGAFIALGYLLDIRVTANLPKEWGSFSAFLGASVFPLGLVLIVLAGGELLTGNMMAVSIAFLSKKVTARKLLNNWVWITLSNFVGALFVAYIFGHLAGLTAQGPFLEKTVSMAQGKLAEGFWESFFSGIGCNWLVGLAVWLSYGAEEMSGKILAIWFPIMGFVAIGFQHVVANMFVIPAAIFGGHFSWLDYLQNFIPVFLGNAVGGSVFVGMIYWLSYKSYITPKVMADYQITQKRKAR